MAFIVAGFLVIGIALGLLSLIPAIAAKTDLRRGAEEIRTARALLLAGDVTSAERALSQAQAAFRKARSEAESPLLRVEGLVPFLGRTPRSVESLARIGDEVAGAGRNLTHALGKLPDGLSSLLPSNQRLPLSTYRSLGPVLASTVAALRDAQRQASLVPRSFVLPEIGRLADLAEAEIGRALALARPTQAMLGALPRFAGAGSPRHYLVGLLNPGELRGPGGYMGLYSVATFDGGRVSLTRFTGAALRKLAPGPEWTTISSSPDIPTVGRLLVRAWNRSLTPRLDGVVFLDPQLFSPLLRAVGSIRAPGIHYRVNARNAVAFTTNQAYFLYHGRTARKAALATIASEAIHRFLRSPGSPARFRHTVASAGMGYMALYATDPKVERAFRQANAAGAYGPRPGQDFFGVVVVNQGGNKIDYYVRRRVRYEVELGAGGTATARASVVFANGAPAGRPRSEVFGTAPWGKGAPKHLDPGDDFGTVHFDCGAGCTAMPVHLRGKVSSQRPAEKEGTAQFGYERPLLVGPRQSKVVRLALRVGVGWSSEGDGGVYRLRLQDQPVIEPTKVTVVIRVPSGMQITGADPSVQIVGGQAVWRGTLRTSHDIEVHFQPEGFFSQLR